MLQNTKSTDNTLDGLKPENANRERKVEALIKVRNGVVAYFSDPELQQSILDMKNAMKAVAEVNASDWVWPGGMEGEKLTLDAYRYAFSIPSNKTPGAFVDLEGREFGSKVDFDRVNPVETLGSSGEMYFIARIIAAYSQLERCFALLGDSPLKEVSSENLDLVVGGVDKTIMGFECLRPKMSSIMDNLRLSIIEDDKAKESEQSKGNSFVEKYDNSQNKEKGKEGCSIF